MRKLGIAIGLVAMCCLVVSAGTIDVKPIGKPFRAQAAPKPMPVVQQQYPVPVQRVWQFVEGGTIDTQGNVISGGNTRVETTVYDNTVNTTGYGGLFAPTELGIDNLYLVNAGTLKTITFSIMGTDDINKLTKANIKLVILNDMHNPPTAVPTELLTTSKFNFETSYPGGMGNGQAVGIAMDVSAAAITITEAFLNIGVMLEDIETSSGTLPTYIGQLIYNPPAIGSSFNRFCSWQNYDSVPKGTFTFWYVFSGLASNMYWGVTVDPTTQGPKPIYDNTVNGSGYANSNVNEVTVADDQGSLDYPAGEALDAIDFTVWNNGTPNLSLDSVEWDIVLREMNPVSADYYPMASTVGVVIINTSYTFSPPLAPWYLTAFTVSGLAPYNLVFSTNVLSGLRFRNQVPAGITECGQWLVNPPVVGSSDVMFQAAGGPNPPDGSWFWFGGDYGDFYWKTNTAFPCPPGDVNCDGVVNGQDIDGFVLLIFATDPGTWSNYYAWTGGACNALCGDMNGDGAVNGGDIDGFVAALFP